MLLMGPHAIPSLFKISTHAAELFSDRRTSRALLNSPLFRTRSALLWNLASERSGSRPNAWHSRSHICRFPAAILMYPSLERNVPYGAMVAWSFPCGVG